MITLVLVTTTQCNLTCKHCLRGSASALHLPFDIVQKAVNGAKAFGIENIHLTGGEPFLYDHLPEIFELSLMNKIPLTFSSNGSLLVKNSGLIQKYKKVIRSINISIESHVAEIHEKIRGKGTYQIALEALEFLKKEKVPFGILACLNKWTTENLSDFAKFAKRRGAQQINFTTVLPCAHSVENDLILSEDRRAAVYQELLKLVRVSSLDFFRLFYVPVYIGEPIFASKNVTMCANQSLRSVTVDVEGSVHFCCFLTVYDVSPVVEKRLRIASLKENSFEGGFKQFSETIHRFLQERIGDYGTEADTDRFDFNSCFYCNRKLGIDTRIVN